MSYAVSSSGRSAGGRFAKTVLGSSVRWYSDRCGAPSAKAWSRSASRSASVWPGSAYIRSRLKVSKLRAASSAAAQRLRAVMHAPERAQVRVVEGLHADRQPVDAGLRERAEAILLEGAGVGLHRDLAVGGQRQQHAQVGQQARDAVGREQRGRAAADEDRLDRAAPDERQRALEVGAQRRRGSAAPGRSFGVAPAVPNSCELKSQYGHFFRHHGRCT